MNEAVRSATKSKLIKGASGDWEVVIGMEVHAQVTSQAKLFSGASTKFGGEPNAHVSLVDAAMPGMLPVINKFCVEQAIRTGLGIKKARAIRQGARDFVDSAQKVLEAGRADARRAAVAISARQA